MKTIAILFSILLVTTPKSYAVGLELKGTVKNSTELFAQLTTALVIKTALDKDPLPVIQLAENLPGIVLLLPPSLFLFERVSNPVTSGVLNLLEKKYPTQANPSFMRTRIARGTGMLSGAVVLKLMIEAMSGDLVKYFDVGWRGEIASFLAGMGLGFGASELTAILGAKGLTAAGVSNPVGATAVGFIAGSVFFLTCDPVHDTTSHFFKKRRSKKELKESLRYSLGVMRDLLKYSEKKDSGLGAFKLHTRNLMQAFEAYQSELLHDMLRLEFEYLRAAIEIQQEYYKKIRVAEWVLNGSHPEEIKSSGNIFNWADEKLPLQLAIELSLDRGSREFRIERHIELLKNELLQKLTQLEEQYKVPRNIKMKKTLRNRELIQMTEFQYRTFVTLIRENFKGYPILENSIADLNNINEKDFLELSTNMAELQSAFAFASGDLPEAVVSRGDLLFEALSRISATYRGIRRETYLENLSEKAQQVFRQILGE